MRLSVLERYWPHDKIVHGLPGQEKQLADTITLIRNMGMAGTLLPCAHAHTHTPNYETRCDLIDHISTT